MNYLVCEGVISFLDVRTRVGNRASWSEQTPVCSSDWLLQPVPDSSLSETSELVSFMFTNPDYISAFSLGCLGAWSIGVMLGQIFKYIAKLRA